MSEVTFRIGDKDEILAEMPGSSGGLYLIGYINHRHGSRSLVGLNIPVDLTTNELRSLADVIDEDIGVE